MHQGVINTDELMNAIVDLGMVPEEAGKDWNLAEAKRIFLNLKRELKRQSNSIRRLATPKPRLERNAYASARLLATSANDPAQYLMRATRMHVAKAREIILQYDANGDGKLNKKEFTEMVARMAHKMERLHPQQRVTGKWSKPPADIAEPQRTERLLAHPFTIFHDRASDCQVTID